MPLIDVLVREHGLPDLAARQAKRWGERLRTETAESGVEAATILDADTGAPVGPPLLGGTAEVDVDPLVRLLDPGARYVAVHTHPASSAFSDLDLSTFLGVVELVATVVAGVDGTWYVLSKPSGEHFGDSVDAVRSLRAEVLRLLPWYRAQVQARRLDARAAWRAHSHEAWRAVAPALRLRYSRVEPSKGT